MSPETTKLILDFLEKVLPSVLGALGIGYAMGQSGKAKIQKDLAETKLKHSEAENALTIEKLRNSQPDSAAIDSIIKSGASGSPPPNP